MSPRLAIIADDLTGALDTGAPFVACGMSVSVAILPEALEAALARGAEVVVVNTASRALPPAAAAERVRQAAAVLGGARPERVFKKIDSRLKGNVGPETAATAAVFGLDRVLVAPAVPDQGRTTRDGAVIGTGVEGRLPIAALFEGTALDCDVRDAGSDADLDRIAATADAKTLLVGARGLGAALARRLGHHAPHPRALAGDEHAVLFAIGSRDPITAAQVADLRAHRPGLPVVEAPDGEIPGILPGLPQVFACSGTPAAERAEEVAARFAQGVARAVNALAPRVLFMSGGDTALAVLSALDIEVVNLEGEVVTGIPIFNWGGPRGENIQCLVKSGGFGKVGTLSALFAEQNGKLTSEQDRRAHRGQGAGPGSGKVETRQGEHAGRPRL